MSAVSGPGSARGTGAVSGPGSARGTGATAGHAGLAGLDWATLRPMAMGRKAARTVRNPVIEPLWVGRRVLARVEPSSGGEGDGGTGGVVEFRDAEGSALAGHPSLQAALLTATGGATVVLDGFLVMLPPLGAAMALASGDGVEAPGLGEITQTFTFGRRRDRAAATPAGTPGAPGGWAAPGAESAPAGSARTLSFVAVDLLALDGDSLLDVPLLERKRLLAATIAAGELVRRTPHVRPPAEAWYRQWRALGFHEVTVKDANSRYLPGTASPDWTVSPIPQR